MQVYISIDMEGIAGIATMDQVIRGGHGYGRAQALMTAEANAAIAGAFAAGAETVVVNDSHGTMDNLIHVDLDRRVRLVSGTPKVNCMAAGISADHDMAMFIGYHAPAGSEAVLAHTFSAYFTEVRLNGKAVSEAEVTALQTGSFGVPVGLVTGDDVICDLVAATFPNVTTVPVKKSLGYNAVDSLSPDEACALIERGAAQAVRSIGQLRPYPVPDRLLLSIDMPTTMSAEFAAMIPGVERTGARTVERDLDDPSEVVGLIMVLYQLASAGQRAMQGLVNRT